MRKEDLLKAINALPDGIEVCVFDHNKNANESDGEEGCSEGIYKDFQVYAMTENDVPKGNQLFAVIDFKSDDV